ncbi:MAG: glycosyltransferase family 4 protein [Saprospiraceae bacterium]|nr:glycosyltransferase family 4 protein [Saprospiraceae bacterium]
MHSTKKTIKLKDNRIHIISFDIPYPADYGGVMDIYYKVKALAESGLDITLHCFQYRERTPQVELEKYCTKVHYYKRTLSPLSMLSLNPFIVQTRASNRLLRNLKENDAPILFEGLHTCAFIHKNALKNRQKLVRMHNTEWEYYHSLMLSEPSFIKKMYFKLESWKLKRFEKQILPHANAILSISPDDTDYFNEIVEKDDLTRCSVVHIPPFHPNSAVESRTGTGKYVLFHGKLSVSDNEKAAIYLIDRIFSKQEIPLSIAGKNPSERLLEKARLYDHIKIIANPNEDVMTDLIQNAQINVLLSFQRAGMKLKLLNALYRGRHCVVNRHMVQNTGLESLCYVKNTSKEIRATVESLMNVQFSINQISDRRSILEKQFSNKENAAKIIDVLENASH